MLLGRRRWSSGKWDKAQFLFVHSTPPLTKKPYTRYSIQTHGPPLMQSCASNFLKRELYDDAFTNHTKSEAFRPPPPYSTLLELVQSINAIRNHAHHPLTFLSIFIPHGALHGIEEVAIQHLGRCESKSCREAIWTYQAN